LAGWPRWAAALRRSELVALEVGDLSFEPEGVVLTIRRSKTDREGAGATVPVPFGGEEATCPVGALRRWLAAAAIRQGRVFRRIDRHGNLGSTLSDRALAEIVATRAAAAGLEGDFAGDDPTSVSACSGMSLSPVSDGFLPATGR
jgi:integrase